MKQKYKSIKVNGLEVEYEEEEESRWLLSLDAPLTLKGIGNLWPRKAKATLYKLRKLTNSLPKWSHKNSYIAMGWSFWNIIKVSSKYVVVFFFPKMRLWDFKSSKMKTKRWNWSKSSYGSWIHIYIWLAFPQFISIIYMLMWETSYFCIKINHE